MRCPIAFSDSRIARPDLLQIVNGAVPDHNLSVRLARPDANLGVQGGAVVRDKDVAGTEEILKRKQPWIEAPTAAFTNQSAPKNGRLRARPAA